MAYEQLVNQATTSLSSGIDDSQTTFDIESVTNFPLVGDYRIRVEDEIMLVTARAGSTLTVTRDIEGTSAASHIAGIDVNVILTTVSMARFLNNHIPLAPDDLYQNHSLTASDGSLLVASDFTWFNQSGATLADLDQGGARLTAPPHTSGVDIRGLRLTSPGTPYSVIAKLSMTFYGQDGSNDRQPFCGVHFSEGSKIVAINWADDSRLFVTRYTSPATFFSNTVTPHVQLSNPTELWLKLEDDGTNITFSISQTGTYWNSVYTELRGAYFDTAPDNVGFHINAQFDETEAPAVPAVPNWSVDLLHWSFE